MNIQEKVKKQITEAMKAKDEVRLRTLRGVLAAFTNELVAKGRKPQEELEDDEALTVIKRLAKQRKDSIEQFKAGNRSDLVKTEEEELGVLEEYLPKMMGQEEIIPVAKAKMKELGVTDKSDMGKLMGAVMQELKGKADGTDVKTVVEKLLEN